MNKPRRQKPNRQASGFTVVEVILALAISSLFFAGVIGGASANVSRERYRDSVQSFAEFLRGVYSDVISTENPHTDTTNYKAPCTITSSDSQTIFSKIYPDDSGNTKVGRSNCFIYGKAITFGEDTNDPSIVHVYDVIGGDAARSASLSDDVGDNSTLIEGLRNVNADVLTLRQVDSSCKAVPAGESSSYQLEWDAYPGEPDDDTKAFTGTIVIARSPSSGSVGTIYLQQTLPVQNLMNTFNEISYSNCYNSGARNSSSTLRTNSLSYHLDSARNPDITHPIKMCINSDNLFAYSFNSANRRMIEISANGNNASAVGVKDQDTGGELCH